jgi:hypothetical protein
VADVAGPGGPEESGTDGGRHLLVWLAVEAFDWRITGWPHTEYVIDAFCGEPGQGSGYE